jgi:Ser/Thr protein kinase RdoA (MazF antagonist)
MISILITFIYDIMISLNMKTQPTPETKLADWILAFNSISNRQTEEAQILRGLVNGLKNRIIGEGMIIIPGVA